VLEKSESLKAEGLCAVRSSKAGYFNPPAGRPVFVPGFNWLQILVTGLQGTPVLAHLCWWTTRGEKASQKRVEEGKILRKVAKLWGRQVIHLWDRGFAGTRSPSPFYPALEQRLSLDRTRWSQTRSLEDRSWQTLLGTSYALGRALTASAQDRCDRFAGSLA